MNNRVYIFDTTLRDGEQSPGCSMTTPEKLRMAHKLVELGVDSARLGTVSYGEEQPLDPRSTEDAWSKNRRAHFVVSG